MNRKALVFSIALVFMMIAALSAGFYLVVTLQQKTSTYAALGDASKSILSSFVKSQEVLTYIDALAAVALHETIDRAAKEAGMNPNKNLCGTIDTGSATYVVWNTYENQKVIRCYAQEPIDEYVTLLFDEYITTKFSQSDQEVAKAAAGHYNYFIQPKSLSVYGIATRPVDVRLELASEKSSGIYTFRPSFTVQASYDLTIYDALHTFADHVIETCKQPKKEERLECINAAVKDFIKAQQGRTTLTVYPHKDTTFLFDARVPHYRNPYNQEKPHVPLRFALKFNS